MAAPNLGKNAAEFMPADSWWLRPREGFTEVCQREFERRIRWSYFGTHNTITARAEQSTLDQFKSRRRFMEGKQR